MVADILLTTAQAAKRLGITPDSVRHQIARGRLLGEKRGRDYFIPAIEVARYATARRMGRPRKGISAPSSEN